MVTDMNINNILKNKRITKYRLSKLSGVPNTTINDLCSGKTRIEKCSGETLYKIAQVLHVSMEMLIEDAIVSNNAEKEVQTMREESYEYGLPEYLQYDLDAYKAALEQESSVLDCLWGELYGSINLAEINDGVITHEHADYLRNKYLLR